MLTAGFIVARSDFAQRIVPAEWSIEIPARGTAHSMVPFQRACVTST